jgi:hypothetical protein
LTLLYGTVCAWVSRTGGTVVEPSVWIWLTVLYGSVCLWVSRTGGTVVEPSVWIWLPVLYGTVCAWVSRTGGTVVGFLKDAIPPVPRYAIVVMVYRSNYDYCYRV